MVVIEPSFYLLATGRISHSMSLYEAFEDENSTDLVSAAKPEAGISDLAGVAEISDSARVELSALARVAEMSDLAGVAEMPEVGVAEMSV